MASKALAWIALLLLPGLARADLYDRPPESWVWYQDPAVAATKDPSPPPTTASAADGRSAREVLKAIGEEMEEAEARSVLNPTTDNIRRAIELKKQALALSQTYADRYEQVVWKHPELDYTIEKPMRTDALYAANPLRQEQLYAALRQAASRHALVYVFRSDCPYCKKFAPLLKTFAAQHGFTVLAFTLDGAGSVDFPYPKTDLSQLRAKGMLPKVVPALYLVNPREGSSEAVGFGLMNSLDLENRVALAAGIEVNTAVATPSRLQD